MITPSFGLTATERVLPRMALDFTTASLDPRVTFTRVGATATVVNSSGVVETVAADIPRFDFDPTTLICKGLLIEESRQNVFTFSGDYTNIVWSVSAGAVSSATVTNPDGSTSGALFTENTATAIHTVSRAVAFISGTAYSYSVWVKSNGRDVIEVGAGNTGTWAARVRFNIATGQILASTGTGTITAYPNGWYRCTVAGTANATAATTANVRGFDLVANSATYEGDGVSGFYLWGGQFEVGAFGTSYIPTEATAVTRNADVATMTGTNFSDWFNASEGAFYFSTQRDSAITGVTGIGGVSDGTTTERMRFFYNNATTTRFDVIDGVSQCSLNTTVVSGAVNSMAAGYKLDSFASSANGGAIATDTSGTLPTVNQFLIGGLPPSGSQLGGHVRKIYYWPQRITNAEIQAFSK
jgi:hypothetical protein